MRRMAALLLSIVLLAGPPAASAADASPGSAELEAATAGVVDWYKAYAESDDFEEPGNWDVIGLSAAGADLSGIFSDKLAYAPWETLDLWLVSEDEMKIMSVPVQLLTAMATTSSSGFSKSADNAAKKLGSCQAEDGSFFDTLNFTIYAVIALESACPSAYDRAAARDYILSGQLADSGFAYAGESGDVDMTALTLQALGYFRGEASVDAAIERAVGFIEDSATENGGFVSPWAEEGVENANSAASVILGFTAVGRDVAPYVRNLLSFRQADGGFAYETGDAESNYYATQQALLALTDAYYEKSWTARLDWVERINSVAGLPDAPDIAQWARAYVSEALEKGLMSVRADGSFAPRDTLTRAELSAALVEIGGPVPVSGDNVPDHPVTRRETAEAVAALLGLEGEDAVQAVKAAGIMQGDPSGNFRPEDLLMREEAAKVLNALSVSHYLKSMGRSW